MQVAQGMFRETHAVEEGSGKVMHRAIWDEGTRDRTKGCNLRESSDNRKSGFNFPQSLLIKHLRVGKQWANPKGI